MTSKSPDHTITLLRRGDIKREVEVSRGTVWLSTGGYATGVRLKITKERPPQSDKIHVTVLTPAEAMELALALITHATEEYERGYLTPSRDETETI